MNPITIRIHTVNSEPVINIQAMALLFGIPAADLDALPRNHGQLMVPAEWVRRGRRRTKQAQAHTGSAGLLDVLDYWAKRDHDATGG